MQKGRGCGEINGIMFHLFKRIHKYEFKKQ